MSPTEDIQTAAVRITWIGAIVDTLLGLIKLAGGWLTGSSALIADGIHSLSDLITDAMVVIMLRLSHQPADREHPWGHGRIETLGTVIMGAALIAVAGGIGWNSILSWFSTEPATIPGWQGLLIALVSIVAKEAIYQYTAAAGRRLNSDLLLANAWHSRTDALSSVAVLVGIGGAQLGFPWLDSLAALVVAMMIAQVGISLSWNSILQLIDTAPPEEELQPLLQQVRALNGVRDVHDVKARYTGSARALELHLVVAADCTASEGHHIAARARQALLQQQPADQIIIHIDTDLDESEADIATLPDRQQIITLLQPWLETVPASLLRLDLHYQHATVALELCFSWTDSPPLPPAELAATLRAHLQSPAWLDRVRISYGIDG